MKKSLTAIVFLMIVLASCTSRSSREQMRREAYVVTVHSDKDIIIELLHEGSIPSGVTKLVIDSNEYICIRQHNSIALQFHGNVK